ncbi:MAG: GTPase HflX [Candidatus Nitrosocaldus sp.]
MNKALLITYPYEDSINEALALAEAAGYRVVNIITQRYLTKSKYGIGSGKLMEVKALVDSLLLDAVIFDEVLKPTQEYNLASALKVEIIDRERLILNIFERRASTAESRIQVKLAQLRYEMARAREKVRLAKKGEQPGFYGLGRYEVDDYYRDVKRRISTLKRRLDSVVKRRALYRRQRSKEGLPTISLAGYTSAGKTTLFNTLTREEHETGHGMFTTLSTYTRAINIDGSKYLLSDTVGFISKLPAYMIEAFRSTLEELTFSDLVVLVIDASEPIENMRKKYESSMKILNELQVPEDKIVYALNKIDLVGNNEEDEKEVYEKARSIGIDVMDGGGTDTKGKRCVAISAKTGKNIEMLLDMIRRFAGKGYSNKVVDDVKEEEHINEGIGIGDKDELMNMLGLDLDEGSGT